MNNERIIDACILQYIGQIKESYEILKTDRKNIFTQIKTYLTWGKGTLT